jgi:predicted Zn finger-like uncharacterized protein
MNVTCERCNTEYDFDDTLVSGRGTTVKCTNCGHLFKVRKKSADPAAAPEKWTVRTVDGRELQFNALRELQAAITQRLIGREDVLSRGSSRPRRLGAITELEPFFSTTGAAQPHTTTAPGIGASGLGIAGGSSLGTSSTGTAPATAAAGGASPAATPPARGRSTPQAGVPAVKLPSAHAPEADAVMDSSDMQEDQTVVRPNPVDPQHASPGHNDKMFPPPARAGDRPLARSTTKEVSPPPAKPTTKDPSPVPGKGPEKAAATARSATPPRGTPTVGAESAAKTPEKPPARPPTKDRETTPPVEKAPARPPTKDAAATRPPEKPPARPPTKETAPGRTSTAAAESKSEVSSATPPTLPAQRDPSEGATAPRKLPAGLTATPAKDVKISHIGDDDPRASSTSGKQKPTKRSSGLQRIIAFVAVGVLLFVGATEIKRRYIDKPVVAAPAAPDERIAGYMKEANQLLNEGDIQGAQSKLDSARALAEKDPKVAAEIARIAAVQADFKWLRLRLLPIGDPEQPLIQRELDVALERARKEVEHARTIAPEEPVIVRRRIDLLRISGNLQEARKLVASLPGAGSQPESALVLAALDLAEEKPSWPSVIERLRTAVVGEQSIGRARSMLIYALVRSGDVTAAKAEYDQLAGMPRPHPLLPPLREFIARAESATADAGADAGELTVEETIRLANELRAKGEPKRAEEMLLEVLKKHPTNADAAVGLGDISRSRNDLGTAARYYEQALRHNGTHLAALTALADMKWDANERQTALGLYRRIVEAGGSTSYAAHARTRLGGPIPDDFINTPPPPTYPTTPPPPTHPTTPPPVTTQPTVPPPPTTTEPPPTAPPTTPTAPPTTVPTGPSIFEPEN